MNFADLKTSIRKDWDAQSNYREEMRDDFRFFDGHQWTTEERYRIENETARMPITFNRTQTIIAVVSGSEINNRTEVRFIPREIGDIKPNEVLTAGAQWFRDESDAEDEESHAFQDHLICGLGFTETWLDFESDPDGAPKVTRIDPEEMCWDCHAVEKGLRNSRRFARIRRMAADAAQEMFEEHDLTDIDCGWISDKPDGKVTRDHVGDEYKFRDNETGDGGKDTVLVVQAQWREKKRAIEYMEGEQRKEIPKAEWDRLTKLGVPTMAMDHREIVSFEWKQAYLGNTGFLKRSEPCKTHATFTAITGHWDREEKRFYGLLQAMRDPQKYANKWLTQTLHIINTNAKGGVMVERDAVDDVAEFEESYAASDEVTWVARGAMAEGKIQPKPQVAYPAALMQLTELAISSIRDVPGVSLELLGQADRQQAGVLEYQRRQSAMTTLAFYFDALRYYRKRQGHVILYMLQKWIAPTGRLVRLVRDGLQQYVPLAMDEGTEKYDVIVDDSPSAPNEKERAWAVLERLLPMIGDRLPPELWADILEHSPLPSSLTEKVREFLEQQKEDPAAQLAQQAQQIEMQKTKSETEENQSQTALNYAKAESEQAEVQLAPLKMIAENKARTDDTRIKAMQANRPQQGQQR